ncbi:MAG TPA: methyltransferase [Candidatus Limnocylindrales bacterium]|nr:methyltransferase [Candidatus Limnocylindrales bacterium]
MDQDLFRIGQQLADVHRGLTAEPMEFDLLDRRWSLMPGVYSPTRGAATRLFSQWLPYPQGGSFLEVGCGTGVTAVTAALAGCARVVALDINEAAVHNTRANATRHGVADRVEVVHSDLFDALDPADTYDVIFWNSNVIQAPAGYAFRDPLERAVLDPGYEAHRRYLAQGINRRTGTGRLFLGYNSLGHFDLLDRLATEAGLRIVRVREQTELIGGQMNLAIELQLLELQPAFVGAQADGQRPGSS